MKNGFNTKKLGIVIVIIIVLSIIGFVLGTAFKDNNPEEGNNNGGGNDKPVPSYSITSVYQAEITNEEQAYEVNGSQIVLKLNENSELLVNNNVTGISANAAYVTNQVIILGDNTPCGFVIKYVIDKDGNSITFDTNNYKLIDFRMYEAKCVARNVGVCQCKTTYDYCEDSFDIVITYDGQQLMINELT